MVDYINTFGLNVHMHDKFDYDDVHVKLGNLFEDSRLVFSSILMASSPYASKSIAMPNDLDENIEITWEVLKVEFILKKNMGLSFFLVALLCGE